MSEQVLDVSDKIYNKKVAMNLKVATFWLQKMCKMETHRIITSEIHTKNVQKNQK